MISAERSQWIDQRARAAGFDLSGVAPVELFDELRQLPEWLQRGYAGEMKYLHDPRRQDPQAILPGARSLIVVAMNYNSGQPVAKLSPSTSGDAPRGWISRYAWGDDYHEFILKKLNALIAEMRVQFPEPFEARAYVDTGPIVERVAAKYAGLGWLAKNTFLINSRFGSWLFLGVIVTTLELQPTLAAGQAPPADLCGTCKRCLDACPTQAFPKPYILDSRRCISYLTIELRDAIPEEFRGRIGNAVIGCDICQDVCPWNRNAPVTPVPAFQPRQVTASENLSKASQDGLPSKDSQFSLLSPELERLASLSQQEFSALFRASAVKRAKWRGLVRNACVALGNSELTIGEPAYGRIVRLLDQLAASDDALIAEHARWALARLQVGTVSSLKHV
jgi:epoxyqueuosine reductase